MTRYPADTILPMRGGLAVDKLLLKVAEAADMASVSRTKAYELIAAGEWKTVRIGSAVRVVLADLERWVAENAKFAA